jgi:L-threonylcarbamoyladenylate synthase
MPRGGHPTFLCRFSSPGWNRLRRSGSGLAPRDALLDLGGTAETIGIRWPAPCLAAELCARFGPLAATSANHHGEPPLCSAKEVATIFSSNVRLVLDGGTLSGEASTVVDLTSDEPSVLREGALSIAEVKEALLSH